MAQSGYDNYEEIAQFNSQAEVCDEILGNALSLLEEEQMRYYDEDLDEEERAELVPKDTIESLCEAVKQCRCTFPKRLDPLADIDAINERVEEFKNTISKELAPYEEFWLTDMINEIIDKLDIAMVELHTVYSEATAYERY